MSPVHARSAWLLLFVVAALLAGPLARSAEAGSGSVSTGSVLFFLLASGGFVLAYIWATLVSIHEALSDGPKATRWRVAAFLLLALGLTIFVLLWRGAP